MTTVDPIIEEIHAVREEIAREANGDMAHIAELVRRRQKASRDRQATVCVSAARKAPE